uniref:Zinc finger CCCH domain-containing protein 7B-like n=1 Tax=Pundamilia nyererei TaxID=303518 RepID=A0A3B4HD84_9CICH
PDPDGYQDFLTQLVCNLLDEGNAFFRDGQCEQAVKEFSEGLNVSCYAETEEIKIPEALLESLYVNRAAAYHSLGEYEQGVLDCNSALEVCKDSRRALYKKALCLKGLGKYKEAYDCSASYLLINPQVKDGQKWEINFPSVPQSSFPSTPTSCSTPTNSAVPERSGTIEDSELMGDDIDSLLDCVSTDGTSTCTQRGPSVLPAPTPQLPPAFFSSAVNQLNSLDSFSGSGLGTSAATLDILDDLSTSEKGGVADASNLLLTPTKLDRLDGLDSLDSLDDALDKMPRAKENQRPGAVYNPLSSTHEFLQACSACYPREDLVHNCKRDILLCRLKADPPLDWTRVRPLPILKAFGGRFLLCKELGVCKYGEKCTFAYNQMEIDVWTEEKKGRLDRTRLFGTKAFKLDPVSSIICLLQENKGTFMFLCQACYDSKPRIISKRFQDDQTICSNLDVRHNFDANKCLAFVVRTHNVIYKKVRPLSILCHMDLCNQAIRYGCVREDNCHYAHSVIELKTWKVQRETGVSPDEIVRISAKYHDNQEQNSSKQKGNRVPFEGGGSKPGGGGGAGKSLNMRMKFACGQCWLDGLISEPDKGLKHCGAKARHAWTKDRRVLLVKSQERSKWVQVRPLPHAKDLPAQYYMCAQILEKRKCSYSGVCTFAHSPEEKDMWMYMKNNDFKDMQQMYDMWLELSGYNRQADGSTVNQPSPEEKYITMPTDYAEPMSGFHCRLCGKHSNSERQWQQHISTEKHKDRVFSCEGEDEALTWSYRFPGALFYLITDRLDGRCPDGACCDYAHSPEELQEWIERREFLRQKLAKAREDMLVMPDEVDFGKYNFLLQD